MKIKAVSSDSYGLTGFAPTAKQDHKVPRGTDSPARPGAGPGERGTPGTALGDPLVTAGKQLDAGGPPLKSKTQ